MILTLERDIHKFRVIQGESIYQTAGIAPFGHDLRMEEQGEGAGEGLLENPLSGCTHLNPVTPPPPL